MFGDNPRIVPRELEPWYESLGSMLSHVHVVILAGGSGSRFWPASRRRLPKQFLPLAGRTNEPLIAATMRRIETIVPAERVWVATGAGLVDATAAMLPRVPRAHLLGEPVARNTAPCLGWAVSVIARVDPQATIAVLPADHHIGDENAFRQVLERALQTAHQGWLTTIGVIPTRPETGYGYIEVGEPIGEGVSAALRFVEKPDRARARAFVDGGRHLWNAGMFFFRASDMLAGIGLHLPALASGLERIDEAAQRGDEARALAEIFPTLPAISIDHGVMEKAQRIAVVPGSFGWNDVGSWEVAWEMAEHDARGNAVPSGTVVIDAANNMVVDLSARVPPKRYALVGVDDLVIVETEDAVLVVPRARAQDVRAVVEALQARGETNLL